MKICFRKRFSKYVNRNHEVNILFTYISNACIFFFINCVTSGCRRSWLSTNSYPEYPLWSNWPFLLSFVFLLDVVSFFYLFIYYAYIFIYTYVQMHHYLTGIFTSMIMPDYFFLPDQQNSHHNTSIKHPFSFFIFLVF